VECIGPSGSPAFHLLSMRGWEEQWVVAATAIDGALAIHHKNWIESPHRQNSILDLLNFQHQRMENNANQQT
jgi:hypothetical protein